MKYKVYIESLNNFPLMESSVSAYLGFKGTLDIFFFEDINEVPISKYNIVVACIETTNKYFSYLGLPSKKALNVPPSLLPYVGRKIYNSMTVKEFKEKGKNGGISLPIFIKPNDLAKEWAAGVIGRQSTFDWCFSKANENSKVFISEVIDIISEYRCYIVNGEVKGIYHYLGDIFVFPDVSIIKECVEKYIDAPAGYSLDVGITKEGKTVVIECNDGWSLGNYGLDNSKYANLLMKRWIELTKNI